jgi:hypothetical protein
MPDDIRQRLRSYEVGNLALQSQWVGEMHEAADEIERLEQTKINNDVGAIREEFTIHREHIQKLEREVYQLRAALLDARAENEHAKSVIRDLLTSYLATFGGNKDELAHRAELILEK